MKRKALAILDYHSTECGCNKWVESDDYEKVAEDVDRAHGRLFNVAAVMLVVGILCLLAAIIIFLI